MKRAAVVAAIVAAFVTGNGVATAWAEREAALRAGVTNCLISEWAREHGVRGLSQTHAACAIFKVQIGQGRVRR